MSFDTPLNSPKKVTDHLSKSDKRIFYIISAYHPENIGLLLDAQQSDPHLLEHLIKLEVALLVDEGVYSLKELIEIYKSQENHSEFNLVISTDYAELAVLCKLHGMNHIEELGKNPDPEMLALANKDRLLLRRNKLIEVCKNDIIKYKKLASEDVEYFFELGIDTSTIAALYDQQKLDILLYPRAVDYFFEMKKNEPDTFLRAFWEYVNCNKEELLLKLGIKEEITLDISSIDVNNLDDQILPEALYDNERTLGANNNSQSDVSSIDISELSSLDSEYEESTHNSSHKKINWSTSKDNYHAANIITCLGYSSHLFLGKNSTEIVVDFICNTPQELLSEMLCNSWDNRDKFQAMACFEVQRLIDLGLSIKMIGNLHDNGRLYQFKKTETYEYLSLAKESNKDKFQEDLGKIISSNVEQLKQRIDKANWDIASEYTTEYRGSCSSGIEIEFCCTIERDDIPEGSGFTNVLDHSIRPNSICHKGNESVSGVITSREELSHVVNFLKLINDFAYINSSCGLHIHVGIDSKRYQSDWERNNKLEIVKQVLLLYVELENAGLDFPPRDYQIKKLNEEVKSNGYDILSATSIKDLMVGIKQPTIFDRSDAPVNLHSIEQHGTLEFRAHNGSVNARDILAWHHCITELVGLSKQMVKENNGKAVIPNQEAKEKIKNMLVKLAKYDMGVILTEGMKRDIPVESPIELPMVKRNLIQDDLTEGSERTRKM